MRTTSSVVKNSAKNICNRFPTGDCYVEGGKRKSQFSTNISRAVSAIADLLVVVLLWYAGLADVEEGEVNGQELLLASTSVGRMSFGAPPAVKQANYIQRVLNCVAVIWCVCSCVILVQIKAV